MRLIVLVKSGEVVKMGIGVIEVVCVLGMVFVFVKE